MALLMQKHGNYNERLTQNLIDHKVLHQVTSDGDINVYKNYFISPWILSDAELASEIESLISRNELSVEYTKSIQDGLLWLIELFDIKWRELHDLDYISRLKLFNLQKRVEFILDNLFNSQNGKTSNNEDQKISIDESKNDISNTEEIRKTTEEKKENLNKTDKTETNKSKFLKTDEHLTNDTTTLKVETRIMIHPESSKYKGYKDKSPTIKINPINQEVTINKPLVKDNSIANRVFLSKTNRPRDKNLKNETNLVPQEHFSKSNQFLNKSLRVKSMKHHKNRFNQSKNISLISPSENITGPLQATAQPKHIETTILHESLKNVTDFSKNASRGTLDTRVSKNKDQRQKDRHRDKTTTDKIANDHRNSKKKKKTEMKFDIGSAMDEILGAVDEVLSTASL